MSNLYQMMRRSGEMTPPSAKPVIKALPSHQLKAPCPPGGPPSVCAKPKVLESMEPTPRCGGESLGETACSTLSEGTDSSPFAEIQVSVPEDLSVFTEDAYSDDDMAESRAEFTMPTCVNLLDGDSVDIKTHVSDTMTSNGTVAEDDATTVSAEAFQGELWSAMHKTMAPDDQPRRPSVRRSKTNHYRELTTSAVKRNKVFVPAARLSSFGEDTNKTTTPALRTQLSSFGQISSFGEDNTTTSYTRDKSIQDMHKWLEDHVSRIASEEQETLTKLHHQVRQVKRSTSFRSLHGADGSHDAPEVCDDKAAWRPTVKQSNGLKVQSLEQVRLKDQSYLQRLSATKSILPRSELYYPRLTETTS